MGLLFFNWFGYKLVLGHLEAVAYIQLEEKIDTRDYDEAALMEIRVPLNIPYQTAYSDFERHYGEIEVNGKHYSYVKRKIENGVLILKCLPNHAKQMITNAGNDLFRVMNNIDQDNGGNNPSPFSKIIKSLKAEYDPNPTEVMFAASINFLHVYALIQNTATNNGYTKVTEQPPDLIPFI
ncbi:MAG TPA: hypothetical protein VGD17_17375 [Chitinophagaceae bacterium]